MFSHGLLLGVIATLLLAAAVEVRRIFQARRKVDVRLSRRAELYANWRQPLVGILRGDAAYELDLPASGATSHRIAIDLVELLLALDDEMGPFAPERMAEAARRAEIVPFLLDDLRGKDEWKAHRAAYFCGRLGLTEAVPYLRRLVYHRDPEVAFHAMEALCLLGDAASFPRILELVLAGARLSTFQASVLLSWMGRGACRLVAPYLNVAGAGLPLEGEMLLCALDFMIDERCPELAAWVRATLRPEVPGSQEASSLPPPLLARAVRAAAVLLMHEETEHVAGLACHTDPSVRVEVARALGALGGPRSVPVLERMLADSDWWVRLAAAEALLACGPEGEEILRASRVDAARVVLER